MNIQKRIKYREDWNASEFCSARRKITGTWKSIFRVNSLKNKKYNYRFVWARTLNWSREVQTVLSRITYTSWITFLLSKCFLAKKKFILFTSFQKNPSISYRSYYVMNSLVWLQYSFVLICAWKILSQENCLSVTHCCSVCFMDP